MKVTFICCASAQEGMGHLYRCQSLIEAKPDFIEARLIVNDNFRGIDSDIVVFDLNNLDRETFEAVSGDRLTVSLSPLFEHDTHLVFNRTRYVNNNFGVQVFAGLEYAIIGSHCKKIDDTTYSRALERRTLPVGFSMTGQRMWEAIGYCGLLVCNVGITPYEAVYAGIPSVVITPPDKYFLIRELEEKNACMVVEDINSLPELSNEQLWEMRNSCKGLIDNKGASRIWRRILE